MRVDFSSEATVECILFNLQIFFSFQKNRFLLNVSRCHLLFPREYPLKPPVLRLEQYKTNSQCNLQPEGVIIGPTLYLAIFGNTQYNIPGFKFLCRDF